MYLSELQKKEIIDINSGKRISRRYSKKFNSRRKKNKKIYC